MSSSRLTWAAGKATVSVRIQQTDSSCRQTSSDLAMLPVIAYRQQSAKKHANEFLRQ